MLHIHCGRVCFHSTDLPTKKASPKISGCCFTFWTSEIHVYILSNKNHTTFTVDVAILSDLPTFTVSGLATVGKVIVVGNTVTVTSSHRLLIMLTTKLPNMLKTKHCIFMSRVAKIKSQIWILLITMYAVWNNYKLHNVFWCVINIHCFIVFSNIVHI